MRPSILYSALLAVTSAQFSLAQTPAGAPADAPTSGYRAEFLTDFAGLESKYVRLAEQMPAEKYTWRPGEGVRSVSEVFLHMAQANYGLARRLGATLPEGFQPQGFDKSTTDKAKVIEELKKSFAHFRAAALKASDADADKTMPWFGGSTITQRAFLSFILRHAGEHLGQSIAYARINGVKPAWSE